MEVVLAVLIASCALPEPVTVVGVKFAVAPVGNPVTVKLVAAVYPFWAVIVPV